MLAFVPAVREFSVFAHTIYFGLATRDDHYPVCRLDVPIWLGPAIMLATVQQ